jgi:hypothetical protein
LAAVAEVLSAAPVDAASTAGLNDVPYPTYTLPSSAGLKTTPARQLTIESDDSARSR